MYPATIAGRWTYHVLELIEHRRVLRVIPWRRRALLVSIYPTRLDLAARSFLRFGEFPDGGLGIV